MWLASAIFTVGKSSTLPVNDLNEGDEEVNKDNGYSDKNTVLSWNTTRGSEYLKYNQFDLYFEKTDGTYISEVKL